MGLSVHRLGSREDHEGEKKEAELVKCLPCKIEDRGLNPPKELGMVARGCRPTA